MDIELNRKQQEVMALPIRGHVVVLGTAGSGKTTIALLRACHLAAIKSSEKVLLVTFNGALVQYIQKIIGNNSSHNLIIENYHKFARGYLNSRGLMPSKNGIASNEEKAFCIKQALDYFREKYPTESTFKRSLIFFIEEITFIEKFGFSDFDDYKDAERIGRASANVKRQNRILIFNVYEKYKKLRKERGYKYDWDDLAFYVFQELKKDSSKRRYKHIIVDEGQDFSPMMLKSLVEAIADDGSFTFFGDVAQQIYGSRLSWRDSGISTSKIWRFDINYRNPVSISKFAKAITKNKFWRDDSDMIDSSSNVAEGPKPVLIEFANKQNEIQWIVEKTMFIAKSSSVVIVCRNRADIDSLRKRFFTLDYCNFIEIDKDYSDPYNSKKIYLSTFHAVKGLEFDNVLVPYLSEDIFPDPDTIANSISIEEACADEIKLLYVAATRSKYGLYMTYCGTLTPLFPQDSDAYDFYSEEDLK